VQRIIGAHGNELRACAGRAAPRGSRRVIRLKAWIAIDPDGSVSEVAMGGETELDECVVDALHRWRYPASSDGKPVQVTFPFEIAPE
jgi:hypothetical protein